MQKFYIKIGGEFEQLSEYQVSQGYFQYGFQNPLDIGIFCVLKFVTGVGTCLVPVYGEDKLRVVATKFAGKYLHQLTEEEQKEFYASKKQIA